MDLGKKAILLLTVLGYNVHIPVHTQSGRTFLSKGRLYEAQKIAIRNVKLLSPVVKEGIPLIGLEASAILSFRDEYIDLVADELSGKAAYLAENSFYIDEFISGEIDRKNISGEQFTEEKRIIKLHGHCHQKALL